MAFSACWMSFSACLTACSACWMSFSACLTAFSVCLLPCSECLKSFSVCLLAFSACLLALFACQTAFSGCQFAFSACLFPFSVRSSTYKTPQKEVSNQPYQFVVYFTGCGFSSRQSSAQPTQVFHSARWRVPQGLPARVRLHEVSARFFLMHITW